MTRTAFAMLARDANDKTAYKIVRTKHTRRRQTYQFRPQQPCAVLWPLSVWEFGKGVHSTNGSEAKESEQRREQDAFFEANCQIEVPVL